MKGVQVVGQGRALGTLRLGSSGQKPTRHFAYM